MDKKNYKSKLVHCDCCDKNALYLAFVSVAGYDYDVYLCQNHLDRHYELEEADKTQMEITDAYCLVPYTLFKTMT